MARLEDLTVGSSVSGLVNNQSVQIVAVKWYGSSVLEITYKNNQGIRTLFGSEDSVVTIHGGMLRDERRKVEERFRQDKDVRILIATDHQCLSDQDRTWQR